MFTSQSVLEHKAALFDALFKTSGDAILVVSAENLAISESNPEATALLGYQYKSLKGKPLPVLADGPRRKILEAYARERIETGDSGDLTIRLVTSGSDSLPCDLFFNTVEIEGIPYLLITIHDLTERMRAREEIEMRDIAIGEVSSGVTIADARQPDLPLIFVNKGFEKMTGYRAEEAIGRSCRFLQGEERDQPELQVLRKCLLDGTACIVQLKNFRKDGSLFYNELHISPVHDDQGELTHFVGIQLDATESVEARKSLERSEERYRQALEREQELNEIKTRFISMVSHEFRTPMTGMQASAALLRRLGDKMGPEGKLRHLENIENSLRRMNRLLDDVLFFSQGQTHKIKVARKAVHLSSYFRSLIESLGPTYPDREITFDIQGMGREEYFLDEHLLDHIFHNLIGNALKYSSPEEGVHCQAHIQESQLVFSIQDEGIGVPERDQPHLFDAFHRAENVGTRQGTGLGLNIAHRAAELLQGKISFTSSENHGSTFTVSLPIIDPQNEHTHHPDT